mmetsp:Transcript_20976/g.37150  ORF Transcript_20976/g.37150 Transcript_20976/m.37150 type:complete len:267 (-) Transcript_20976:3-803(-)
MKTVFVATLVAMTTNMVFGECPNQCSGHGRCTNHPMSFSVATATTPSIELPISAAHSEYGYNIELTKKDSCTCFTRKEETKTVYAYKGADCSQRTCPHGRSWDGPATDDNEHAVQMECSGRGTCDTSTGTCQCFPGYTGKGCRRSTCPNDCSGHGTCKTLKEIAALRGANTAYDAFIGHVDAATNFEYEGAWDSDKVSGCMCDSGFRGADCSRIECPSTTDVMGGAGAESGRECSGRGICDYNTGSCQCFETFGGDKCEILKQSYL